MTPGHTGARRDHRLSFRAEHAATLHSSYSAFELNSYIPWPRLGLNAGMAKRGWTLEDGKFLLLAETERVAA